MVGEQTYLRKTVLTGVPSATVARHHSHVVDYPDKGGLRLEEAVEALTLFIKGENFLRMETMEYNPLRNPGLHYAKISVDSMSVRFRRKRYATGESSRR